MKKTEIDTAIVPVEWVVRVMEILYKVSHENSETGKEACCLGSYIPGFLDSSKTKAP